MSRYRNGFIPKDKLVKRGSTFYATPGTWDKWDRLVALVKEKEGVTLRITPGNNAYRDYASQVEAKKEHGKNAAFPGTSSHGGVFKGKDALAIDVNNWMLIGEEKFYRYCLQIGFEPGYFDWEPWHIIDWEPWRAVAPPKPPAPKPVPTPEEIEMATEVIVTVKDKDNKPLSDKNRRVAFVDNSSGFNVDFSWLTVADADKWAKQVGMPNGAIQLTDVGFDKWIARLGSTVK